MMRFSPQIAPSIIMKKIKPILAKFYKLTYNVKARLKYKYNKQHDKSK